MARVTVTGASGHIGCHVVRALLDRGDTVTALVRPGNTAPGLAGLKVERRDGDLLDAASVEQAVKGAELVVHCGAVHRNWSPNPDDIVRPAVEGTRHVLEAARKHGVRRVVVTSSIATVGYTPDTTRPFDETHFTERKKSPYIRAKCEAEALALDFGRSQGLEVVAVCPTTTWGPRDYKLTPATRGLLDVVNGGPVVLGLNVVDVRDVAAGHLLALDKGRAGQRYLLGGDNLLPAEGAAVTGQVIGQPRKAMSPPLWVLGLMARLMVLGARMKGGDPGLTPEMLHDAGGCHLLYDISKARTELGYSPRGALAVVTDAVRWLLFRGVIKPAVARAIGDRLPADPSWTVS